MSEAFPPRNLHSGADPWGRRVEERIEALEDDNVRTQQTAGNVGSAAAGLGDVIASQSERITTQAEQLEFVMPLAERVAEELVPPEPPLTPSVPTATSDLGVVRVTWDGGFPATVDGEPQTIFQIPGLRAVYAEMTLTEPPAVEVIEEPDESDDPDVPFVPSTPPHPWTRVGQPLVVAGDIVVKATVGDTVWVRLIAENYVGMLSAPTAAVSIEVRGVDVPDFDQAVIDLIESSGGGGSGNKVWDATTPPEVDGVLVGDTWRQFSSLDETGELQGIWRWNGTGWIQTALVVDGSILARHINVDDVWADEAFINKAQVNVLEAGVITGEMISGNAIDGKTITGAIFKTKASGSRLELLDTRLDVFGTTARAGYLRASTLNGGGIGMVLANDDDSQICTFGKSVNYHLPAGLSGVRTNIQANTIEAFSNLASQNIYAQSLNLGAKDGSGDLILGRYFTDLVEGDKTLRIRNASLEITGSETLAGGSLKDAPISFPTGITGAVTSELVTDCSHATAIKPGQYRTNSSTLNTPISTAGGSLHVFTSGTSGVNIRQEFRRIVGTASGTTAIDRRVWVRETENGGSSWSDWVLLDANSDSDWQALAAASGWVNGGMQYKVKAGICYLRGEFYGGVDQTPVFTLPTGARPLARMSAFIARVVGSSVPPWGTLNIQTTGVATFVAVSGAVVSASPGYGMGAISFPVA